MSGDFEIDGIKTAFTILHWEDKDPKSLSCPCGWSLDYVGYYSGAVMVDQFETSIRFHYTHCEKAKP